MKKRVWAVFAILILSIYTGVDAQDHRVEIENIAGIFRPAAPPIVQWSGHGVIATSIQLLDGPGVLIKTGVALRNINLADIDIAQITEIQGVSDERLIVTGLANSAVSIVALIDIASGVIADSFIAYRPQISPTGKYIVFDRFYPPHGPEENDDCAALYDTSATPEENRPLAASIPQFRFNPKINVGKTLFPSDPCGEPTTAASHVMASDSFIWSEDGESVFFADAYDGALNLVEIQFSSAGHSRKVINLNFVFDNVKNPSDITRVAITSIEGGNVSGVISETEPGFAPRQFTVGLNSFVQLAP